MHPKIIIKTIESNQKSLLNHLFCTESHPRNANYCYLMEIREKIKYTICED